LSQHVHLLHMAGCRHVGLDGCRGIYAVAVATLLRCLPACCPATQSLPYPCPRAVLPCHCCITARRTVCSTPNVMCSVYFGSYGCFYGSFTISQPPMAVRTIHGPNAYGTKCPATQRVRCSLLWVVYRGTSTLSMLCTTSTPLMVASTSAVVTLALYMLMKTLPLRP